MCHSGDPGSADLQEVPYETRVQPISFKQLRSGDWRIEQDVIVPSEEVG